MTTMDVVLVPANTVASAKGDGPTVDVSGAANRVFLVTLAITKIIEQESLDLSIYGSGMVRPGARSRWPCFRRNFIVESGRCCSI